MLDVVVARDRDERLLHRLEAFSDIVIGFSLAQVSLSLVVPDKIAGLWNKPLPFIAFLITFALICTIWYAHNRLFARFFVPTALNVVLNFVTLGSVVLLVYSVQLFVRFSHDHSAVAFYAACLGLAYGLLATLYAVGVRQRRVFLSVEEIRSGLKRATRMGGMSAGLFIFLLLSRYVDDATYQFGILFGILFGLGSSRVALALLRRRGVMP